MLKNKNVVLTDDDADDRGIFREAFRELNVDNKLTICADGVELMNYLKNATELPELLFIDLNMPKKSGIECLKEIRSNEKFRDVSIAIFSTSNSERDIEATFNNGADVYICKPNDYDQLKRILKLVLRNKWHHLTAGFSKETFLISA